MGLWNAASPIGMILGSIAAGILQDRCGRRLTLALGSGCSSIAVAILYASTYSASGQQAVFMVGKIVQGLTVGTAVCTIQTYMSEILPSALRGPVIAFLPLFVLIGQLISAGVALNAEDVVGKSSYRTCIASEWAFSVIPVMVAIFMPESPIHLIRKGRLEAATKAQRRLETSKDDTSATIHALQDMVRHETEAAHSDRARYMDTFKGTDRRRTIIAMFGAILPQLWGLPILSDGPYFLQQAGMESSTSLILLVSGIVCGIVGNLASMWVLTVVGRRKLLLAPLIPLAVLWLAMGIAGCFQSIVTAWSGYAHSILTHD